MDSTKSSSSQNELRSPCVSICALDMNDVCVGCYRTGEEITNWGTMTDDEKRQTLELVREREQQSYI